MRSRRQPGLPRALRLSPARGLPQGRRHPRRPRCPHCGEAVELEDSTFPGRPFQSAWNEGVRKLEKTADAEN